VRELVNAGLEDARLKTPGGVVIWYEVDFMGFHVRARGLDAHQRVRNSIHIVSWNDVQFAKLNPFIPANNAVRKDFE
jgi:hypothetical protein